MQAGLLLLIPALVTGLPSLGDSASRNSIEEADYTDCLTKGSVSCVKYKIFSLVDKVLGSRESFTLTEGVTLVKNPGTVPGDGAPRSLSAEEIQKEDVESLLATRVERFLSTHTLKLDLKGSEVVDAVSSAGRALGDAANSIFGEEEEGNGEETARKKIKKAGKTLLPLLLLLKLKAAALIPLALAGIALIAGKALLVGKIALLLSAIIALQKLLSHHHHGKTVTYEIVSHPHHSSSHEHGHEHGWSSGGGGDISSGGGGGGWGRSSDLAYRGYQPQAKA